MNDLVHSEEDGLAGRNYCLELRSIILLQWDRDESRDFKIIWGIEGVGSGNPLGVGCKETAGMT